MLEYQGFTAQLVEHRTGIAKNMRSDHVVAFILKTQLIYIMKWRRVKLEINFTLVLSKSK